MFELPIFFVSTTRFFVNIGASEICSKCTVSVTYFQVFSGLNDIACMYVLRLPLYCMVAQDFVYLSRVSVFWVTGLVVRILVMLVCILTMLFSMIFISEWFI